jgi:hypothetical protein
MSIHDEDRTFLHNLATPITVSKMLIKAHLSELDGSREATPIETQILRLKKSFSRSRKWKSSTPSIKPASPLATNGRRA